MNELSQYDNQYIWRCVEPPGYPIYSPHFRICGCPYRLVVKDDHYCFLDNLDCNFLLARVTVRWSVWNLFNVSSCEPTPPNGSASNSGESLVELFKPNVLRGCKLPKGRFRMEFKVSDPKVHVTRCVPGLENQRATCYLNSILQALFYSQPFRAAFMKLLPEEGPAKRLQVVFAAMELLMHQRLLVQPDIQSPVIAPRAIQTTELTESLGWTRDDATVQGDPHELLLTLLDVLESDKTVAEVLKQAFEVEGVTTVERPEEDSSSVLDKTYILLLPISKCKTLKESLEQLCKEEVMSPSCKKQYKITRFPPVLAISLQRVYFDVRTGTLRKDSSALSYPSELDLSSFGDTGGTYSLFAVVNHAGTPVDGHYYVKVRPVHLSCIFRSEHFQNAASALDTMESSFIISDATVQPIGLKDMLTQDQRETVYMLFYVRTHIDIQSLPLSSALRESGDRLLRASNSKAFTSIFPVFFLSKTNFELRSEMENVRFINPKVLEVDVSAGLEYSLPIFSTSAMTFYLGMGREEKGAVEVVGLYRLSPHDLTTPFKKLLEFLRLQESERHRLVVYQCSRRLDVREYLQFFIRFDSADPPLFCDPEEAIIDSNESFIKLAKTYWKSPSNFITTFKKLMDGKTIVFMKHADFDVRRYNQYIEHLKTRALLILKPLTLKFCQPNTSITAFQRIYFSTLKTLPKEYLFDGLGIDCTSGVKVVFHNPPILDPCYIYPNTTFLEVGIDIYTYLSERTALTVETAGGSRNYTFHQVLQCLQLRPRSKATREELEYVSGKKDYVPPTSPLTMCDVCLLYEHVGSLRGDDPAQYYFYDACPVSAQDNRPCTFEPLLHSKTTSPTYENNKDRPRRRSQQSAHGLRSPKYADGRPEPEKREVTLAYAFSLLRAEDQAFIRPIDLFVYVQNFPLINLLIPVPRVSRLCTIGYVSSLMTEMSTRLCGTLGLSEYVVLLSYTNIRGRLIMELEDPSRCLQQVLGQPLQRDYQVRVDLYNTEWFSKWLGKRRTLLLLIQTDKIRKHGFFQRYGYEDGHQLQAPNDERFIQSLNKQVEECRSISNSLISKLNASLDARRCLRGFWTEATFFPSSPIDSPYQQLSITPENCKGLEGEPMTLVTDLHDALERRLDGKEDSY